MRTFWASLLGTLAISLILSSLVLVWLNRTLTNTGTYVKTVAPLATKPEIQNFIAQKTSTELIKNAGKTELAQALLPQTELADKTTDQLIILVEPLIYKNVLTVVQGLKFAELWKTSNQTAHNALISQLDSNQSQITLDLNPVAAGVMEQLKATQLAAASEQLQISGDTATVNLSGTGIEKVRNYYHNFHKATWAIVAISIILLVLAIVISVNHLKTLRRILVGAGVLSLIFAFAIKASTYIAVGNNTDEVTRKALITLVQTLLHNLFLASLILGITCIVTAIGLKIFSAVRGKKLS